MKNYQLLFLSITVALLTACGSGGSGSGSKKSSSQIATPNKPSKNLINEKETQKGNSENKPSSKPNNGEQQNNPKNETGSEINNKKEQSGNQQGNPEDEPSSKPSDSVSDNLKQAVRDSLKAKVDWDPAKGHSSLVIDGKSYNKGDFVYFSDFELGESEHNFKDTEDKEVIIKGKMKVYRLPYSVIVADKYTDVTLADNNSANSYRGFYGTGFYAGYLTKDLPETGSADYVGKSLYNDETGDFKLSVNFGKKAITSGEITGLTTGKVTFKPGHIENVLYDDFDDNEILAMGFKGKAILANGKAFEKNVDVTESGTEYTDREINAKEYDFEYSGHFFGPKAKEVAGNVEFIRKGDKFSDGEIINFAGQRGKIKKP